MSTRFLGIFVMFSVFGASHAWGQWESGSDGSDGAFNPAGSVMVDLSLAIPGDALTTPGTGNGVYDATRWVVCFKYTSINVPAGATITFGMHPSGAPVVWLATGNVTIDGRVNLDGEDGIGPNPPIIPYYTRPGPGGFEGGQAGHSGAAGASFGLGPGSSPTNSDSDRGAGASHANIPDQSGCCGSTPLTGPIYGDATGMPLLGGSGGNVPPARPLDRSGGAGGGAILIAAPVQITLGAPGSITAQGGDGTPFFGAGSGGTIRLRAATVSLAAGSQIIGRGGVGGGDGGCGGICGYGGDGRVRIEGSTVNNGGTINGSQSFPGAPSVVFPASPPRLFVTSICGQAVSGDPAWGMKTADVQLNSASACTVNIGATGVPQFNIVEIRVIPARGIIFTVNSTPLSAGGTATANVTFPAGRSEIQLRANW